ncbi:hypothetical protein Tco_0937591 [Tanacetum coccineum]|uniref:Peptidase A2 domain-containing protein n=1 Tax=Tanacetum coccineum TaxID=301880 RepID=A0ABQ5DHI2_9ASTR
MVRIIKRRKRRETQNAFTCDEWGSHFKKTAREVRNETRGKATWNAMQPAKVYVVGNAGTNPDSNVVTDTFLLNDRYASILFDTGADRRKRDSLNIMSCTKTHKYLLKGHNVFLAHVTTKETEDKSGEKRLEDVPIQDTYRLASSNERVVGTTARTIRQGLYKTQFLTLGSSGLVCQKEGWIIPDVH